MRRSTHVQEGVDWSDVGLGTIVAVYTSPPPLPTDRMKLAHGLHGRGMTDRQIGGVLGCTREWACKLRGEYRRRTAALAELLADPDRDGLRDLARAVAEADGL